MGCTSELNLFSFKPYITQYGSCLLTAVRLPGVLLFDNLVNVRESARRSHLGCAC